MITIQTQNIIFQFPNIEHSTDIDNNIYKELAKYMTAHFSDGLTITVKINTPVNYLYLTNNKISPEQLFDEFWNFRERYWFKLPQKLIKNNHLTLKY